MPEVFIGLGSNLGDTAHNLREAVRGLRAVAEVKEVSSLWRTEPVGLREQPFFLNAVVRAHTPLPPGELLARMAAIENALGRLREVPMGPRTIDLDLLLYDDLTVELPGVSLPHPRMGERRFVLAPLAELAPHARIGRGGPTVAEALAALPAEGAAVERLSVEDWPPALV